MKVKGWRNIKLLGATSFLTDVSSEIMHSVLPFFIVSLGGGGFIVGVIGGLGDVISNIFKVISGYISDKIRRCKSIVALGYFTSSLSKLLLSFSTSWLHVMVIRPIERIGKGIRTAPRDALIAASIDESQRGRAFGLHRALDTAGAILGVILAIALLKFLGEAYNQILLIAGIIAFTALIPLAFVEEARMEKKRAKETAKIPLRTWIVVITMTIFAVGNFTYMLFLLRGESFFTGEMRLIGPI
ncbi:MFS transporter, partial [archaeon]